jgi:hypothetical protein
MLDRDQKPEYLYIRESPSPTLKSCGPNPAAGELPVEEPSTTEIEKGMQALSVDGFSLRFVGKASGAIMTDVAMALKGEVTGQDKKTRPESYETRPEFWRPTSVSWLVQ